MSRCIIAAFLLTIPLTLSGCAEDKVTRQNYDQIIEGKSNKDEVRLTLGDKYANRGDHWEYEGKDEHLSVVFYFDENGVVRRKEWIDAETGEWDGAAPHIDKKTEGRNANDGTSSTTIKK